MNGVFSGPRLRAFRRVHHLEARDLAILVGRSEWMIWAYETGRAVPPLHVALRMADVFGISVEDLVIAARDEQAVGA